MKGIRHVTIVTMGCSKNLVDSEQLLRQFEAIGYAVGHDSQVVCYGLSIRTLFG